MSSPTVCVRPDIRLRAIWLGVKPSSLAVSTTLARVPAPTSGRPLSALDAVARETPAVVATSASVTARGWAGGW